MKDATLKDRMLNIKETQERGETSKTYNDQEMIDIIWIMQSKCLKAPTWSLKVTEEVEFKTQW